MEARLLTLEELAGYIKLAPRTLYNAVAPKAKRPFPVKPKRIGKCLRFDRQEVDNWIDSGCKWEK